MLQHSKPAYAKFDPAHLLDGVFIPTKGKKRERLLIPVRTFGGSQISFQGFEQLGADDQSILLAIAAQLGLDGLIIDDEKGGEISRKLKDNLKINDAFNINIAAKKTSLRSLLIDAGYNQDKSTDVVAKSLNRLANAQIREVDSSGYDKRCNLISTVFNKESNETFIAANPRLTAAVFSGQHIKVSLFERNRLETEIAKILHCWLCSNVRLGKSLGYNNNGTKLDTLMSHVWGNPPDSLSSKIKSNRRSKLRDALIEVEEQTRWLNGKNEKGWKIEHERTIVHIARPSLLPMLESKEFDMLPSDYHKTMTSASIEVMNQAIDEGINNFMKENFLIFQA